MRTGSRPTVSVNFSPVVVPEPASVKPLLVAPSPALPAPLPIALEPNVEGLVIIRAHVAGDHGLQPGDLLGPVSRDDQTRRLAQDLAIWLARKHAGHKFDDIARAFGLVTYDVITVIKAADERIEFDKLTREYIRELRARLPVASMQAASDTDSKLNIRITDIKSAVADYFNVTEVDMISSRRSVRVARPRQIAMYLCKALTTKSYPEIGRRFGGRDHATVIHAVRRIGDLCQKDPDIAQALERLSAVFDVNVAGLPSRPLAGRPLPSPANKPPVPPAAA